MPSTLGDGRGPGRDWQAGTGAGTRRRKDGTRMQYVKLGSTGLDVSRICLGCMSYGGPEAGTHQWSLGEDEARPFFRQAIEAGINFFDTANVYSAGTSEEITGDRKR